MAEFGRVNHARYWIQNSQIQIGNVFLRAVQKLSWLITNGRRRGATIYGTLGDGRTDKSGGASGGII